MKVIHKYILPFQEVAYVSMPYESTILRVDGISGQLYVWAVIDTENQLVEHKFYLFKTGMEMPNDINSYYYHGCGAIFIGMELMMYVYTNPMDQYQITPEVTKWEGFPK
jgi:hypothetical protein